MIHILLALLLSQVFAVHTDCEALLQAVANELSAARADVRSKFINGKISEYEYSQKLTELNEKASVLKDAKLDIGSVVQPAKEEKKEKSEQEVRTELRSVLYIDTEDRPIIDMDFNPSTKESLLGLKRNNGLSGVFKAQNDLVDYVSALKRPADKSAGGHIEKVMFWPGNPKKALIDIGGAKYSYDNIFMSTFPQSVTYLNENYTFKLRVSNSGNWIYPYDITDGHFFMASSEYSTSMRKFYIPGSRNFYDISMSPQEDYIVLSDAEGSLNVFELKTEKRTLIQFLSDDPILLGAGISENSKLLNILYAGKDKGIYVAKVEMESLKRTTNGNIQAKKVLSEASKHKVDHLKLSGFSTYLISPNGKFLAIRSWNNMREDFFTIVNLDTMQIVEIGTVYDLRKDVEFKFTQDSNHIIFYSDNLAAVYGLFDEKAEVEAIE